MGMTLSIPKQSNLDTAKKGADDQTSHLKKGAETAPDGACQHDQKLAPHIEKASPQAKDDTIGDLKSSVTKSVKEELAT